MTRPALLLVGALAVGAAGCGPSGAARERDDPNTVEREDAQRDVARVEDMLRGQVAGVEVVESPGGLRIRIRGSSGFTGDDPLFVIDGLPIQQGADGALVGINPRDIQSIRVLKDVAETAAYGARGANGVVLITTRRPPPPPDDDGS